MLGKKKVTISKIMSEKAKKLNIISLFHKSVLEGYDVSAWFGVSQPEPKALCKNLSLKGPFPSIFREKSSNQAKHNRHADCAHENIRDLFVSASLTSNGIISLKALYGFLNCKQF